MTGLNAARLWVAALSDPAPERRDWGRARLLDAPTIAVPALIEALGNPYGRQGTVAALLAHLGADVAILPLRLSLANERSTRDREEISIALAYLETRVRHSRRLYNGTRLLQEVQPYLGREISVPEREQVNLVFELGVELCTTAISEDNTEPVNLTPPELTLPETIGGLVKLLHVGDSSRADRADEALREMGAEATPTMREALSAGRPAQAARLAVLLGDLGDLPSIAILLRIWPDLASGPTRLIVLRVLVQLAKKLVGEPTAVSIATLRDFLIFAKVEFRPEEAFSLVQTILNLAASSPSPELRTLLPHLKGRWLSPVPPSFERARLAIEEATEAWKDLPLPALSEGSAQALPVPAGPSSPEPSSLPKASERR